MIGRYALLAALVISSQTMAATVTIPSGTKVLGELDQEVTSNVKKFEVGDLVRGHVWRNVMVDGNIVVQAGAPMTLRVADITKRKIAGRGGDVEVQAVSVRAVDGTEIFLDGGYDKQGSHRTGLSASLSALVFWPAIFIRGKEAVLEPGTVFDASIPADTRIHVSDDRPRTIRIGSGSDLTVEILYDAVDEKAKDLPLRLTLCDQPWPGDSPRVTAVNDAPIDAIAVETAAPKQTGSCSSADGSVQLKALSEHFRRGINRFTVTAAAQSAEVVLDIEM